MVEEWWSGLMVVVRKMERGGGRGYLWGFGRVLMGKSKLIQGSGD
jgi:hypothetical protein